MAFRPCAQPGCPELVEAGRCQAHQRTKEARRGNSAERGYDSDWKRFREWFVRRHPLCADCCIKKTTDVHHVKKLAEFPELRLAESNCMGLCHECHAVRTQRGE